MKTMSALFMSLTTLIGACVAGPGSIGPGPSPSVSTDLAAVSRSNPNPGASNALDACSITDTKGAFGKNGALGIDLVVGMGQVPHARDAAKYVRLAGVEPEIQTDDPAWLIVVSGPIQLPLGRKMWDATCVYIDGQEYWFGTGNREEDGKIVTPAPLPQMPIMSLPELVP